MSTRIQQVKNLVNKAALPVMLAAPMVASAGAQAPQNTARYAPGSLPTGTGTFESTNLIGTISTVINFALGFLGILIFLIFLYAGFEYATAGGEEGKTQTARSRMINAVVGLIIIFFAFVASNAVLGFVFGQ